MLRSMYSGIGGMKNFQVKLDVIGNNIANVNTYGYKKGRTTFKDLVSQQISGATAPGATTGGVNPKQVGLGSQLAAIDTIHTQGSLQTTGRPLDIAISGDGFFALTDGTNTYYTRAGNFYIDKDGSLVNSDGLKVVGTEGPIILPTNAQSMSIGKDGSISIVAGTEALAPDQAGGNIGLVKFANPDGLQKAGGNLYLESDNSGEPADALLVPGEGGSGTLVSGALEMSNVDLSEEFTEMIVAQRGFQANTKIITTSDEILQELVNLKR